MSAAIYDLEIEQGADKEISLELIDFSNNSVIDITGWTFSAQMRERYDSPKIAATFTVTVTNASNGALKMSLTNTQTGSLNANIKYVYDLEATRTDSKKLRIIQGKISISPEVTR